MTETEARQAFMTGAAVEYVTFRGGIRYEKISAVIFRRGENGGTRMLVELADRSGHSVMITLPEHVRACLTNGGVENDTGRIQTQSTGHTQSYRRQYGAVR